VSATARIIAVADHGRSAALRTVLRSNVARAIVRNRDHRIAVQSVAGVLLILLLTMTVPGVLFVVGPLVLGVPHVASDLRYLVLRRGRTRAWLALVAAGSVAIALLRVTELVASASYASTEIALSALWIASAALLGGVRSRRWLRVGVTLCVVAAVSQVAMRSPHTARTIFAFGHNGVALLLWVLLFRRSRLYALPALLLIGVITWGFVVGWSIRLHGPWAADLAHEALVRTPLSLGPRAAIGLGLAFVFLQSVHYAVWLSWIPQEDVASEGTTTFSMSARAIARDLGTPLLVSVIGATILVAVAAVFSLEGARNGYLSIATFHAYLELAAVAYFTASVPR
jgi:hypothetical protein